MQVQVLSLSGICFAIMPEDLSFAEVFDNYCLSFLVSKVQRFSHKYKTNFVSVFALATYANVSFLQVCPRIKELSLPKY